MEITLNNKSKTKCLLILNYLNFLNFLLNSSFVLSIDIVVHQIQLDFNELNMKRNHFFLSSLAKEISMNPADI